MPLGTKVVLGPGDTVMGISSQKMGTAAPTLSTHVLWPKACRTLLDGHPFPTPKGAQQPSLIGPCLLWPNGWIDQDARWYRVLLALRSCLTCCRVLYSFIVFTHFMFYFVFWFFTG